ncbi:MAG TPA: hypothetical protein VH138_04370 [Vicinamibacterales bacterium]|nr:hypothetical protein [Vicinamibacterales bacterium]
MRFVEQVVRIPVGRQVRDALRRDLERPAIDEQDAHQFAERGVCGIVPRIGTQAEPLPHISGGHFLALPQQRERRARVQTETVLVVQRASPADERVQRAHDAAMNEGGARPPPSCR